MGKTDMDATWEGHIKSWERSGKSQREFCRLKGISFWSFRNWRARLKPQVKIRPAEKATLFVEVGKKGIHSGGIRSGIIRVLHPSGTTVEIGCEIDPDLVTHIVKAVCAS